MLTDDLARLKELDPATYSEILHFELAGYHQPRNQALDHLQGCLQRAIAVRGWHWLLEDADPTIVKGRPGFICDIMDAEYNDLATYVLAESPIAALLTAYIAALEAQG